MDPLMESFLKLLSDPKLYVLIFAYSNFGDLLSLWENKVHLQKVSKYNQFVINNSEFLNELRQNQQVAAIDKEKVSILRPYLEKLKNYTDPDNLKTIYNNLQTAKVDKKFPYIIFLGINMSAYYVPRDNTITYFSPKSLGHEFLHLASSSYDEKRKLIFSGFMQRSSEFSIGRGINEGYTELLASKIYNEGEVRAYTRKVKIARLLELFFDDPKDMEKLYFNHDLPELIHYLEGFAKRDEIIKFLIEVDHMSNPISTSLHPIYPTYASIKTQLKLHNWFMAKSQDADKKATFEGLIRESKMASIILDRQNTKLHMEGPFAVDSFTNQDEHKPKI